MKKEQNKIRSHTCCTHALSRRNFLAAAGSMTAAAKTGVFAAASSMASQGSISTKKPRVRAVFIRPNTDRYWLGWPGTAYDIKLHQQQYTKVITDAAQNLGIDLNIRQDPLSSNEAVTSFIESMQPDPPDGLMVIVMSLNSPGWDTVGLLAKNRGDIPTIVFSPMGTSFTGQLQKTRGIPKVFCGATQDMDWLNSAMKMLKTVWQMKNTRLCVVKGDKVEDQVLNVIGTTLHYIPRSRFPEEFNKMQITPEMRDLADHLIKNVKMIVEPDKTDIMNAVKNYFVAKRILADEGCDGISVDCLPLVSNREIWPPCLAWTLLNDEGICGICEADWNAAISMRLTHLLCDRPGFIQDPAPNTVNNTLMGAHCSCPTKLDGLNSGSEPFIFRSHSESDIGVSLQVLWREGQKATIMKFQGPEKLLVGTGRVVRNIDTPPSGGCRTSLELELDGVPNCLDTKGFHQLFIYGDLENQFKAYCQLAGITVEHI